MNRKAEIRILTSFVTSLHETNHRSQSPSARHIINDSNSSELAEKCFPLPKKNGTYLMYNCVSLFTIRSAALLLLIICPKTN